MEISIDDNELNALAFACAELDVHYYVLPSAKPGMSKATVKNRNGKDIDSLTAYYVGRFLKDKMELEASKSYAAQLQAEKAIGDFVNNLGRV